MAYRIADICQDIKARPHLPSSLKKNMAVRKQIASLVSLIGVLAAGNSGLWAIDVKLSSDEAYKALEFGRIPMERANSPEDVKKVLQQASVATRVGADPEKEPCGASAVLRTKRYRLEAFGRQEAAESKKRKTDVRMPEEFIQKVMDMPNMEMEVQLCGDDEYFAEGALIELQQGSKRVKPIDIGKAERGRKNESSGPAFRSRFTALFAYEQFDPTASSIFVVNLQDGTEIRIPADFSKVK
ncbi:MAG: hypothetical protein P0121_04705 [Nitrospira sp.]|nr:hypothetical protein [Nitrospira sp.]